MRHIGLDLALTTTHKAVVIDEKGQTITNILSVKASAIALEELSQCAWEGVPADEPLVVIMEPMGMASFPVAVFCQRQRAQVFLVTLPTHESAGVFWDTHEIETSTLAPSGHVLAELRLFLSLHFKSFTRP